MISKEEVVFYKTNAKNYPDKRNLFRPSELYPEYQFREDISDEQNDIYDGVRETLHLYGADSEHYGTKEWNPLKNLIKPGDNVLIKPNMVMDYNRSGSGTDCLFTQPSIVAAVLDYVFIALDGTGKVTVGDAPMQECKFGKLIQESGYADLIQYYKNKNLDIELVDFRELTTEVKGGVRHQTINKHGKGTIIDLKDESEFAIYNQEHLNRLRITNYSPDRLAKHHCEGKHEYFVSDYVLNADVIINMPKPKTHRKAGVTIALKNLVGINVRKEFLPHHTIGSVKEDGDEYRKKSKFRKISSIAYDYKNKFEGEGKYVRAFFCLVVGYGIKIISNKCFHDEMEGSWSGNHTISKTIVDLNKILLYADKNGNIQLERQRKLLNIADMIISGEKEGPVAPSPKYVGYLVLGEDSVCVDKLVATMMGADIEKLPVIENADHIHGKLEIGTKCEPKIVSNNNKINGKSVQDLKVDDKWNFIGTSGWTSIFN